MTTKRLITGALLSILALSGALYADVINLKDGTVLEGDLIGTDNGIVMFRVDGAIRAIPEDQVLALIETGQSTSSAAPAAAAPTSLVVPQGTRLTISMLQEIDSSQQPVGYKFRAQLESALVVEGVNVAPRGTQLMGMITSAAQAGRAVGQSELSIEFTDIMINDQLFPIATTELAAQGASEGANTVRRAARGAAIGGLVNGSRGAKDGAAIAAGASLLTKGSSIKVPRGTILETSLRTPLTVQL